MDAGQNFNLKPCGLGARDTLRLEMGYPLYGHELTDEITPLEAGLERFVSLEKGSFLGRERLAHQKREGLRRIRAGIVMNDGIPRQGYKIYKNDQEIGYVTSGTFSPSLGKGIALALIDPKENKNGNTVAIDIRGKRKTGTVTSIPFVKK